MMKSTTFLQFLCRNFAEKLYASSQNRARAMLYPVKSQLCRYILNNESKAGDGRVNIRMEETAQYLGITQRHLRRILSVCEEENRFDLHSTVSGY